ncbi:amino acid adenylation domain-containing protein [Micromonospora phaseoli]|uniref:Phenyloxazoline synthase MbtB n=1 Tax=Micromonospora phaseoli TaxID=1144548 RepID=A0A1H6Y9R8_9ACTN|nr:non-ribosomal peptide synthetase [Micromonospora phaseoli]PZW00096.1 amino acid adenylation domain-containing protein [Micromonospora phaseoli]GIJ79606.1 non-ribosomal peptide synthetase [Micromonospora phaseoli]SEJ37991.1 amino acid adenylation domain-containing protein [Micromonospora phaseoli]
MDQLTATGFGLSDLQQAYLIGELGDFQLGGPALFYEEYACPPFDIEAFTAAVRTLVRRHPMLRCAIGEDGQVRILDDPPASLTVRSLRGETPRRRAALLAASRRELSEDGPPLAGPAAFRMVVWCDEAEFLVQMAGRLIVFDGQSGEVFAQELRTLLGGGDLAPLDFTYERYRRELEQRRDGPEYAAARRYWTERLDDLPGAPELPLRRGGRHDGPLVRRTFTLPPELTDAFTAALRRRRLTPTMAVAAAFARVLRHWSRQPRFTVNIMYGERLNLHPDVSRLIGSFASTLLLECSPAGGQDDFAADATAIRSRLLRDMAHGAFSGVSVIRELNRRSGTVSGARMPVVFTSMLGLGSDTDPVFLELLGWQRRDSLVRTPQVAFDHQVFMRAGEMVFSWDTADGLYPAGLVDDMFAAYRRLLVDLATEDGAWTSPVGERLTPDRQLAVRAQVNDTVAEVAPQTLHDGFLTWARRTPDAEAVLTSTGATTYRQLRSRAGAVAAALRAAGRGPGDLVAVVAERGVDQIAALLGVLMSGAAYVPVSPGWPVRRRAQIFAGAAVRAVLGQSDGDLDGAPTDAVRWRLADLATGDLPDTETADDPEALAYVIFTSGTTGTPKGVMIRHQSAANTIVDINERFGVTAADRALAVSEFTFDLSVYDVFGLLAVGGTVVVPDPEQAREVVHLHELADRTGVTVWSSVPAYLAMYVDYVRAAADRARPRTLRLAMVSGDWVPLPLGRELAEIAPAARCVALGGATEASIWSNWFDVPAQVPAEWTSVPYGWPLRNQRFHVLDAQLAHRPDWVPGGLYIAGRGLADGYLHAPELTAAAFVTHPVTGERLYRTGDVGRYRPDGVIEFLGRDDPQVKINGFRVELGEIEAALVEQPGVADAVVVARRSERGASLVAFVAAEATRPTTGDTLRGALRAVLPGYLVPPVIEVREALPLTGNGKVDRAALAAAAAGLAPDTGKFRAPRTATQRRLAALWSELLDVPSVGIDDPFFALGGSSLQAAQLMNRVEREFGSRLPLAALYQHRTVAELARLLDTRDRPAGASAVQSLAPGDGPPVVLVHPVGGDLLCYRELVDRLRGDWSLLGLASPALDTAVAVPPTLTELARGYLDEVRAALPADTPVRLVGWSLGAVLAYELGRQLTDAGRACTAVLIDPWVGPADAPGEPAAEELVRAFLTDVTRGEVSAGSAIGGVCTGEEALRVAWPALTADRPELTSLGLEAAQRLFGVFAAHTRALLRYPAPAAPGLRVHLLEAQTALGGAAGGYLVRLGDRLPEGAVTTRLRVPGDHFAVTDPAGVAAIADAVADGLTEP